MVSSSANGSQRNAKSALPTIDVDGIIMAMFAECSGLSGEIEVQSHREGGLNEYEHKLPGETKYRNATLRTGVADSAYLWDWFQAASTGKGTVNRMELAIIMYLQNLDSITGREDALDAPPCVSGALVRTGIQSGRQVRGGPRPGVDPPRHPVDKALDGG